MKVKLTYNYNGKRQEEFFDGETLGEAKEKAKTRGYRLIDDKKNPINSFNIIKLEK